jgi:hypothetical protein
MLPILEVEVVCLYIVNEVLNTLPRVGYLTACRKAKRTVNSSSAGDAELLEDSKVP